MANPIKKHRAAKELYLNGHAPADISKVLELSIRTIQRWAKEGNWKKELLIRVNTPASLATKMLESMQKIQDTAEAENRALTENECKSLRMLSNTMREIDKDSYEMSVAMTIMQKFVVFIKTHHGNIKIAPSELLEMTAKFLEDTYRDSV